MKSWGSSFDILLESVCKYDLGLLNLCASRMSEVGLQLFPYGKIIVKFGYQGYADLVKGD